VPLPAGDPASEEPPPKGDAKANDPISAGFAVGKVELRTSAEDQELLECEAIVRASWGHFTRLGEALRRIRDKQLYKNEYGTFEEYCRRRWGFGRSQAGRYISAAEVHCLIAAVPGMPVPNCEAQVRPLVGLSAQLALSAWSKALSWSNDGHVPGLWVERAVRQELRELPSAAQPKQPGPDKQQRCRLRQSVRTAISELLAIILGDPRREVLIAKVQEIDRLLDPILRPKKRRMVANRPATSRS
jgi:hypothetical protein